MESRKNGIDELICRTRIDIQKRLVDTVAEGEGEWEAAQFSTGHSVQCSVMT